MNLPLLTNRDFKLPDDGWFHLVPLGDYPNSEAKVIQVIDAEAAQAILTNFKNRAAEPNFPGLLVDYDHFSENTDKPSAAAGWVDELANRADGIWGRIRWSDEGEAAIKGGRYRLVSPVFDRAKLIGGLTEADKRLLNRLGVTLAEGEGARVRPTLLGRVAVTNDPRIKGMKPLSNRNQLPASVSAPADQQQQQQTKHSMKNIATKLGLSAEASEDAILAVITPLLNRADIGPDALKTLREQNVTLLNRNTELEDEQIDNVLDLHGVLDEAKRSLLTGTLKTLKNRDERVSYLTTLGFTAGKSDKKDGQEKLLNRAGAKSPANKGGAEPENAEQSIAAKQALEVENFRLANRCTYEAARQAVRRTKPELFGLPAVA